MSYNNCNYYRAWCLLGYKSTSSYKAYGVLYNWSAAIEGEASSTSNPSGVQGICPTGWHLPSDAEWTQLTDYLGGDSVAGKKLREVGTKHWMGFNSGATNETGFTALPGGCRLGSGSCAFFDIDKYGYWWSATENDAGNVWIRYMSGDNDFVGRSAKGKGAGYSVRCVMD